MTELIGGATMTDEELPLELGHAHARIRELEAGLAQLTADNIEIHQRGICTSEERRVLDAMAKMADKWLHDGVAIEGQTFWLCKAELARRASAATTLVSDGDSLFTGKGGG